MSVAEQDREQFLARQEAHRRINGMPPSTKEWTDEEIEMAISLGY